MAFPGNAHMHKHINGTESLTFTEKPDMEHKKRSKPKIVRTLHNKCAYVTLMNGSSYNLSYYFPASRQSQTAVYLMLG